MWLDFETAMQTELGKKDNYIQTFKSSIEFYENAEIQFRTMVQLYEDRISKF